MSDENSITGANDCIIKVGEKQAGGPKGRIIIDDFEISETTNDERRHGVGNRKAQGYVSGNQEVDLSFTKFGDNQNLVSDLRAGNFTVVLMSPEQTHTVTGIRQSDFTVSVSDGGDYELDFNGMALTYENDPR